MPPHSVENVRHSSLFLMFIYLLVISFIGAQELFTVYWVSVSVIHLAMVMSLTLSLQVALLHCKPEISYNLTVLVHRLGGKKWLSFLSINKCTMLNQLTAFCLRNYFIYII